MFYLDMLILRCEQSPSLSEDDLKYAGNTMFSEDMIKNIYFAPGKENIYNNSKQQALFLFIIFISLFIILIPGIHFIGKVSWLKTFIMAAIITILLTLIMWIIIHYAHWEDLNSIQIIKKD